MAIPPAGGQPPAVNYGDLLTGESSEFTTTVGNWTAVGGTLTRDAATAAWKLGSLAASLKYVTTAQNQYIEVPVPGTFRAGVEYVAVVFWGIETPDASTGHSYRLNFGLIGTDAGTAEASGAATSWSRLAATFVRWIPSVARTGVKVRLTRISTETGTVTYHVGLARVARVRRKGEADLTLIREPSADLRSSVLYLPADFGGVALRNGQDGASVGISSSYASIAGPAGTNTYISADADESYISGGTVGVLGDLSGTGVRIEAGDDYIGFVMSQKDADTAQMYAALAGGYIMQLRHRGTAKGWSASDDGTVNARIDAFFQHTLTVPGALTTGTDKAAHFQMPQKARIDEVRVHVGTAPTDAALIVDVNDDGTTIFTTQSNRPEIAAAAADATSGAADGGTAVAKDSVISIDIDQIGSTIAGSDLTVFLRGRYIW